MNSIKYIVRRTISCLVLISAVSCGGGGGGAAYVPLNHAAGIASSGDPMVEATISVWDSSGQLLGTSTTDANGSYILNVGAYTPPLLLKATPKEATKPVFYSIDFGKADTAGVRVNVNQVSDLLVTMLLNAANRNTGTALENVFSEVAPTITASMLDTSKTALNEVLAPIADAIAQSDSGLKTALNTNPTVVDALTKGVIDGPLHTGVDNLLDQLQLTKTSATQAKLTLTAAATTPPIVISTNSLGSQNSAAIAAVKTTVADTTTSSQLQAAPPTVIVSSTSSWGTKADSWSGYTGSLAIWTPKSVSGGWTLTFKSQGLAKQVSSFWNTQATIDKATNTFTLTNPVYGASVAANQVVSIGFSGVGLLDTQVDLSDCRFNGQPCALVATSAQDSTKTLDALLKNFGYSSAAQTAIKGNVNTSLTTAMANASNGAAVATPTGSASAGSGTSTSTNVVTTTTQASPSSAKPAESATTVPMVLTFSVPTPAWSGGYGATLSIKNNSTQVLAAGASGWKAEIKFPNKAIAEDVFKSGPWNFVSTIGNDGTVVLTPQSWAAAVPMAGVTSSGFNGGDLANVLTAKPLDNTKVSIVFDSSVTTPPTQAPVPPSSATVPTTGTGASNANSTPLAGYVPSSPLTLPPLPGAGNFPLTVKGWGSKLEMGTVMIPEPAKDQALATSQLKSIFKYAGDGGDGDPGAVYFGKKWGNDFFPDATKNSMEMAKRVKSIAGARQDNVMPVMVVYTAQLSGGPTAVQQDILDIPSGVSAGTDNEFLKNHYANLMIETALMRGYKTDTNPYPGTVLLNPDMLGALQQGDVINNTFRKADGTWVKVNVRAKLQAAIDYVYSIEATAKSKGYNLVLPANKPTLPADLTDDIRGWFQSQNWVVKTFGQDAIPYGWQLNLWAQGSSVWDHGVGGDKNKPHTDATIWRDAAGQVAAFLDYVGVYQGNYVPDFVAIDRYEFDDFREAARNINYAYDAQDWKNFLTYTRQLASYLQRPAMLWQVPASHLLTVNEPVPNDSYISLHSGAGGSFFMGDPALGVGAVNAAANMKAIPLNGQTWYAGKTTVGDWLSLNPSYDWTKDQLQATINSNVFSILWGGGNTMGVIETAATGNDGGWMMSRVRDYYANKQKSLVRVP